MFFREINVMNICFWQCQKVFKNENCDDSNVHNKKISGTEPDILSAFTNVFFKTAALF